MIVNKDLSSVWPVRRIEAATGAVDAADPSTMIEFVGAARDSDRLTPSVGLDCNESAAGDDSSHTSNEEKGNQEDIVAEKSEGGELVKLE